MDELIAAGMEMFAACKVRQNVSEHQGLIDTARYCETMAGNWQAALAKYKARMAEDAHE